MAELSREDAEEFTQALGQIVAGGWRQIAWADRQGIPAALGMSLQEWVSERIGGYVRLSLPERREAVKELTEQGMSTREIGAVLGVQHSTVVRDRGADAPPNPEPEPEPQVRQSPEPACGADAPRAPDPEPTRPLFVEPERPGRPELSPAERRQIAADREREESLERDRERVRYVLTGWPSVRDIILSDPDGERAAQIVAGLGETDQRALKELLADLGRTDR